MLLNMTTEYCMSWWHKPKAIDSEWLRSECSFYATSVEEAKRMSNEMLIEMLQNGEMHYNVQLQAIDNSSAMKFARKKNTNAWKPNYYGSK